ncbi:MAG TPA: signal recognition particle-docking protein FtsY [Clostridiales bacterium]|nr:signal recognition particle-docking protein FtsY [Clostridiales bacterium]
MGLFSKIKEGLKKTRDSVVGQIDSMLKSFTKIDEELFEELEELLVMGDVGVTTATAITAELRKRVKKEGITDPQEVHRLLEEITADMLRGGDELSLNTSPSIILVIGVNGVGKTTTIGKLANYLSNNGKKVLLAAADTFRAAAIDQLEIWADRSRCEIIKQNEGSDPAAVVFDAISAAKARNADVIICDTAGRLHNKKHLMDELAKIGRVINRELPDADKETLLVLDATTGQNAVNQAREFKNAAGISGIVLTKLDGTAKGGVVLAIREELDLPVKFIGVGEQMDDLQPFVPEDFAKALFNRDLTNDSDIDNAIDEQMGLNTEDSEAEEEQ